MMGTSGGAPTAPTTADGDPVPYDPTPRPVTEARPGDLVFVRAERTMLGAVISELDGCAFSHVGVLDDRAEPTLLSARTDRHGRRWADVGGVRRNALATLVDRGLFVAPLALTDRAREKGLARMHRWAEDEPGPDHESQSRFSYAKLVVVSAALAAVRRRRPLGPDAAEALWTATHDAAAVLAWEDEHPGFYCAEVVAAAYGLTFSVDALWVRDGEPHPVGVPGHPDARPHDAAAAAAAADAADLVDEDGVIDLRDLVDRALSVREWPERAARIGEAVTELGFRPRQALALGDLLLTLWRYDPILARRLVDAGRELRDPPGPDAEPHDPGPLPGGPFTAPPFVAGGTGPLPTALVTPRLLLSSAVVSSVHPLEL